MTLKRLIICLAFLSNLGWAQTVTITGTVLDPNGRAYQNGSGVVTLVPQNQQWLVNGTNPVPTPVPIASLNSFGKFSVTLTNTSLIAPSTANPLWQFSFCSSMAVISPPICFTMTPLSLTSSQDISTQIQAQSALLPSSGGGNNAVGAGANITVTGITPQTVALSTSIVEPGSVTLQPPGSPTLQFNNDPNNCALSPNNPLDELADVNGILCWNNGGGAQQPLMVRWNPTQTWSDGAQYSYDATNGDFEPTPGQVFGNYTIYLSGGVIYAIHNSNRQVAFSGTDVCVVVNQVLAAMTGGGTIYFKNGVYPCNSLTAETATSWTNYYYGIGIPSATPSGSWLQYHLTGESRTTWNVDSSNQTTIPSNGVIIDITPTAISGISGTNVPEGIWQRQLSGGTGFSNEVFLKNIEVRLPTNTRGNEQQIGLYAAMTYDLENVSATYNMTAAAMSAALPAANSFGIGTSFGSSGNVGHMKNVYSAGSQYCYDIQGEHWVADTVTSVYCTYAGEIGRSGGNIYHPIVVTHLVDQENENGWILGPEIQSGASIDFIGYDFEILASPYSGPFLRVNNLYETNNGYVNGTVTFAYVQANVGLIAPPASLFANGGGNFLVSNGNGWGTCGLTYGAHPLATYTAVCPCPGTGGIHSEGRHYVISDSTTNTWGATISGGGGDHVEGYCDGTNITVEAK